MIAIIPMAGNGSRFTEAGYTVPKFALEVGGQPVLSHLIGSLPTADRVLICQDRHRADVARIAPDEKVLGLPAAPNGPLASVLSARWFIDGRELLVNYCDGWLTGGAASFVAAARRSGRQAALVTAQGDYPDYGRTPNGAIDAGIYWFRDGLAFLAIAESLKTSDQVGVPAVVYQFNGWLEYEASDYISTGTPEYYENACRYHLANV